jgi:hypothetical protein
MEMTSCGHEPVSWGWKILRAIPEVGQHVDFKRLTTQRGLAEPQALRGVIKVVKSGQQLHMYRDMALRSCGVSMDHGVRVGFYPHSFQ